MKEAQEAQIVGCALTAEMIGGRRTRDDCVVLKRCPRKKLETVQPGSDIEELCDATLAYCNTVWNLGFGLELPRF
jgi:hypothetical protein